MKLLARLIPASLFGRALLTLVVTFGLFGLITFWIIVSYALTPVAQRSASDLASIMVLSARTLRQLPVEMRDDYRARLAREYQIRLAEERPFTDMNHFFFPYLGQVKLALEERLGGEVEIVTSVANSDRWFWSHSTPAEKPSGRDFRAAGSKPDRSRACRLLSGLRCS